MNFVELETIASRAWPAAREGAIGGWRLYASAGFSGRINACWPLEDPGLPMAQAVEAVEAWYATQGLPPLFKIVGDGSSLTNHLETLGYRSRTETLMMLGASRGIVDPEVILTDRVGPSFEAVFLASEADPADARERLDTLARIPQPRIFARFADSAIGAAAVEGEWAGVFAMRTAPGARRQGLARRVLASLLGAVHLKGCRRVWLQVEADNRAAVSLYASAGFQEAYRYRYWRRPPG